MPEGLIIAFALLIMVGGVVGIFLPFIPAIPLVWLGVIFYGLATDFNRVNNAFLVAVSVLAVATFFFDYVSACWGLKKFEASAWAVTGAVVGGLIGSLYSPAYALLVGPIVGAVVAEMLVGHDSAFALHSRGRTFVGSLSGSILKITVAFVTIGLFLYQVFGRGIGETAQ